MEDCCCRGESEGDEPGCPVCGAKGKAVSTLTLKQMVKPEFLDMANKAGFRFCGTATCGVVYFHPDGERLEKKDIRVRVGLKEREEPIAVCYCFGFTDRMVREEVEATGVCTIPGRITAEVKRGNCACEVRNPQGSCCLGSVTALMKRYLETHSKVVSVPGT